MRRLESLAGALVLRSLNASTRGVCLAAVATVTVLLSLLAIGAETAVFGPQTYEGTGRPVLSRGSFTVQAGGSGNTLRVRNNGVYAALVVLNGRIVLRPSDFKDPPDRAGRDDDRWEPEWDRMHRDWRADRRDRTRTLIEKPVTLRSGRNEIAVAFISRVGTSFTLEIVKPASDTTPPVITTAVAPTPNANGWNDTNVTVAFTCSDADSGVATCPAAVTTTAEGAGQVVSGTATDNAGNQAAASVTLNIDKTPPLVAATQSPSANANGWNNGPVTVTFTATDPMSGVSPSSITTPIALSAEGAGQSASGQATDRAGNVGTGTLAGINIDRTLPSISVSLSGPTANGVYTGPVTARFTCADALSGIATCPPDRVITTIGANQTVSGTATDRAGNNASVTSDPFTIVGLTISDFNPKSAPVGSVINVMGEGFAAGPAAFVTLNRQSGGTIDAPVSSSTNTAIAFVIPTGAATGPITITVNGQSASSSTPLTISASSSFTLSAAPGRANVIQGESAAFAVSLESSNGFSQLAALSVADLPTGLNASFSPSQITSGQTAILTVSAPSGQPIASSPVTIAASATADGITLTQSATVTVNVQAATTSLIGRTVVSATLQTPIAGVTVKLLGKNGNGGTTACSGTTVSDAAGNFALTGLGPECVGPQLVGYDGLTATSPEGKYAGVNLVYTLQAGQVTESPVLVHLPRIDDKETFFVRQNHTEDQTFFYQSIPGLSVTVYRGTTFRLENGTMPDPFPLVAVQVPVDRLPDAKPPVPTMLSAFIVAFQPANAVASQPAAVFYPNTLNTPPGINMTLMTLDPTRGRMLPYGTATVSPGGTQIVPDLDPTFPGHRYGIVNFDWHGPMPPPIIPPPNPDPPNPVNPNPGGGGCDRGGGDDDSGGGCTNGGDCEDCTTAGANPVDLSSGLETVYHTDVRFGGQRGTISLRRYYRTLSTFAGPFGIGTHHNYGYRLDTLNFQTAALINLVTPDGNRFPFTKELIYVAQGSQPPAPNELRNYTNPAMIGAVMTVLPTEVLLRWKNGTVYRFVQPNPQFTPQLESILDPNGNKITITRNANNPNQVSQITAPPGRSLRLTYDAASRITSVTDPIGRTVSYTYNAQGMLETVTDAEGGVTRYEYDTSNRMVRETDARGTVVAQNTYDTNGRVATQTQADGGVFRFEYTFVNPTIPNSPILATTVTDPLGRTSTHRFTPAGFRTDTSLANGQLVAFDRHALTNKIIARRPIATDVVKATFEHDGRGNLVRSTDALGRITVYTYDPTFNRVTSIRDALRNETTFTYDGRGNLRSRTDANNHTTSYEYDANGQLTEVIDPTGHTTRFAYDTFGNPIRVTDPLGNVTQLRFDGASRLIEVVDGMGRRRTIAYDGFDRIVRQTDAKGQTTTFGYDRVGNLVSVTDARNKTTSFAFDALNRLVSRTDPLGRSDLRTYDSTGNTLSFRDRRGHTGTFTYDGLNRLTLEQYSDGSRVERRFDSFGRLVQAIDSGVPFVFDYDVTGALVRSTGPFGSVLYQRDALGRVATQRVSGQVPVTYGYDAAGNLLSAGLPSTSLGFSYDGRNQLTAITRSNGVSTSHTYDSAGQLLSILHTRGSTPLHTLGYSYDRSGSRTSHDTSSGQTESTSVSTATYDDANRLVRRGNMTFAYDDAGNLISESSPGGTTTYAWDSRNRLTSVTAGGQTTTFSYDFTGNLIRVSNAGPLNTTRSFVLDALTNVVYEQNSNGIARATLTGRTIDSHFATVQSGGEIEFSLSDAVNSTVLTVDQIGAIKGQFSYATFGETTANGSDYLFQYTGRVPVSNALYYYRARFYRPALSRFISEDPAGLSGTQTNLFAYAVNSPINYSDPRGLDNPGGDWIPDPIENGCLRRCFDFHDMAYAGGGYYDAAGTPQPDRSLPPRCSAGSWGSTLLGGDTSCDQANREAALCTTQCSSPVQGWVPVAACRFSFSRDNRSSEQGLTEPLFCGLPGNRSPLCLR
jgi:RHS repeat-associated protein